MNKIRSSVFTLNIFVALTSCVTGNPTPTEAEQRAAATQTSSPREARGRNGAAATAHPLASAAALEMLSGGGNAVDAAVAASFVISVVRPQSSGIGGGGFLMYADQSKQNVDVYDFRERAPAKATRNMFVTAKGELAPLVVNGRKLGPKSLDGHLAVAVPGLVAGLIRVHREHGRLPLATIMQPSINAAAKGFPVYPQLAEAIIDREAVLRVFPDSARIFFRNGKPLKVGETLVQTDLAKTLRLIAANGSDGFYRGRVGELLIKEMRNGRGIMTKADLERYQVKKRIPINGTYRNFRIVSMPPPSSGGVHIVQILKMLERDNLHRSGVNTTSTVHLLTEAMRRAFADRARWLGDPDFVKVPVAGLTSSKYLTQVRQSIDEKRATPSEKLAVSNAAAFESGSTTHISIVDRWGNAVSTTQTVNYTFGSGVVARGTGVVLNNEMDDFAARPGVPNVYGLVGSEANSVAAGKTPLSSMSPTFVFTDSGQLLMVVGSPGGPRIITAVLQTIINVLDHEMSLLRAVDAPRIHHQFIPDVLQVEDGALSEPVMKDLTAMGHRVTLVDPMGDVQAIAREGDLWIAVSDRRSEGRPAAN